MRYSVNTRIYEGSKYINHSCQCCDTPFEIDRQYLYLTCKEGTINNMWACSEKCTTMLMLAQGDKNYPGTYYEEEGIKE